MGPGLAPFFVWLTVGLYDPPVRELMGYRWSRRDEWLHRRFGNIVRLVFAFVPSRFRKHPRARAGIAQLGASRPTRRWCTRPRAICRRTTSATTRCITAPRSEPKLLRLRQHGAWRYA
jgi:ER-bound oxygenase mpaB/B'/Rubber oxygenase, catalytic domain